MYKEYFLKNQSCMTRCDFEYAFIGSHYCEEQCPNFVAKFEISKTNHLIAKNITNLEKKN